MQPGEPLPQKLSVTIQRQTIGHWPLFGHCLLLLLPVSKKLQDLFCSLAHFRANAPQAPQARRAKQLLAHLMHIAASTRQREFLLVPPEQILLKILTFECQIHLMKFWQRFNCFSSHREQPHKMEAPSNHRF